MSSMTDFLSKYYWRQTLQLLMCICRRFPLTIISLLSIEFLALNEIYDWIELAEQYKRNILVISVGGVFWFTSTEIYSERINKAKLNIYFLSILILVAYSSYIIHQDRVVVVEYATVIWAMILSITFAAYLKEHSTDNSSFWYFNYQLLTAMFFAVLSAVILCGGISLTLASLEYLFNLQINGRVYKDIWVTGMILLAPFYFLSNIPRQFDYVQTDCRFSNGVVFVLNYILVPLALIYSVVLYVYFVKIIWQGSLPHGQLGIMIAWYGVIGILTYIAIFPLVKRGQVLLTWFYCHFYKLLIVPLGLLAVAIAERISQYGVTESRYLVIVCALWFAVLIVLNLINRHSFQLKQVPLTLALLSVLISFGPWSIHQLPIDSQIARLEHVLEENNLLSDGIINVVEPPDLKVQKSISSIVRFLVHHHAENRIRHWMKDKAVFDDICHSEADESEENICYNKERQIVEMMGMTFVEYWENDEHKYFSISRVKPNNGRNITISGYDILIPYFWLSTNPHEKLSSTDSQTDQAFVVTVNRQDQLYVTHAGKTVITFNLKEIINRFKQSKGRIEVGNDQADKLRLTQTENGYQAMLEVDELQLIQNDNEPQISVSGFILIKHRVR